MKINPDSPQRPLRHAALKAGKVLYLPAPRLAEDEPFLLIVTGCVGVDRFGGRLGKGGGYSDLESALCR